MEPRHYTRVRWFESSIFLVGVASVLFRSTFCWCCPWNCLSLVAWPSKSLDRPFGTDLCSISFDLPSVSENIYLPGLVFWHYHRSPLIHSPSFSGSWNDFIIWTILKIYDWLNYCIHCWLPSFYILCMLGNVSCGIWKMFGVVVLEKCKRYVSFICYFFVCESIQISLYLWGVSRT